VKHYPTYARVAITLNAIVVGIALTAACTRTEALEEMPTGTEVTVMTQDGTLVRGKIAKVETDTVTLTGERPNSTTRVTRTSISEVKRVNDRTPAPVARTITVPDNTVLNVTLGTALASDTSRVEESVTGSLASPVEVDGETVIPSGATVTGYVTNAKESGNVKGRAQLGLRFTRLQTGSVTYDIDTRPLSYVADDNKKDDAIKIGVGAAAGAVIGAITGGKKGAAIGTAVGAGGGTAVVLATDGDEIRLAQGRSLKVSLTNPLTIRTK
jgi:hypothetical protein